MHVCKPGTSGRLLLLAREQRALVGLQATTAGQQTAQVLEHLRGLPSLPGLGFCRQWIRALAYHAFVVDHPLTVRLLDGLTPKVVGYFNCIGGYDVDAFNQTPMQHAPVIKQDVFFHFSDLWQTR